MTSFDISTKLEAIISQVELAERANDLHRARYCSIQGLHLLEQDYEEIEIERKFLLICQIALLSSRMKIFADSIHYYNMALDLSEKLYGKDSINNFTIINKLAIEYEYQGRLKDAEALYRRSLAGRLKKHGPNHLDSVMTTQELGTILGKLGNPEAARHLLETAYIGFQNLAEPDNETAFATLNNLAANYSALGMNQDASRLLASEIPSLLQAFSKDHSKVPYAICNYLRFTTEPVILKDVLEFLNAYQANPSGPGMTALCCYAQFLVDHSQVKNATSIYRAVFHWRKKNLGRSAPETIAALGGLAESLATLDIFDEAEELFEIMIRTAGIASIGQGDSYLSAAIARIQQLQRRKNEVRSESISWVLDKPQPCVCSQSTFRLCSGWFISMIIV